MDSTDNAGSSSNARQKRVLPSRSRRGGPGVGSCDIDLMILDSQRRKFENEPIIPADSKILLTTNSTLFPEATATLDVGPNSLANNRYFDRPEVLKAYREQLIIQTPEFTNVADIPSVGGRFRPRVSEDHTADTSDAAYEKRHRKYETFEKRQRLREREKLKHEQYKLKERIDQLRAMDSSAFLALPASSFSHPSAAGESSGSSLPGSHINGAAAHNEGERRRKEMLDIALTLEERYKILLPPDRLKKPPNQPAAVTPAISPSPEPEKEPEQAQVEEEEAEEEEEVVVVEPEVEEPIAEVVTKEVEKLKLKIRFPPRLGQPTPPIQPPTKDSPRKSKGLQATPVSPSTRRTRSTVSIIPVESPPPTRQPSAAPETPLPVAPEDSQPVPVPVTPPSSAPIEKERTHEAATPQEMAPEADSVARPRKRLKPTPSSPGRSSQPPAIPREPSLPPVAPMESISSSMQVAHLVAAHQLGEPKAQRPSTPVSDRPTSLLLLAAIRSNKARQTVIRHTMAFGTKVPPEIAEPREFELPSWILSPETEEEPAVAASTDSVSVPLLNPLKPHH